MEKAKQYFCAKPNGKLHYPHTILTGFGFLASSIAWAIYDPYITKILNHLLNNSATITSWSAKLNAAFPALAEFAAANGENVTTAAGGITLVPLFIGIIMTFDNIFGVIFQPTFGKLSDNTHSRFGKRRPYVIFGAPISAILFAIIPIVAIKVGSLPLTMFFIILFVFVMSLWRAPVVALMPDLTPSDIRSEGNAVINLMGGIGGALGLFAGTIVTAIYCASTGISSKSPEFNELNTFPYVFLLGAAVMVIGMLIILFFVKEPDSRIKIKGEMNQAADAEARRKAEKEAAKAEKEARVCYLKDNKNVEYCDSKYTVLEDADAMILVTEWKEFRQPDFIEIKKRLKNPVIFDGRNQFDAHSLSDKGFEYYQIGVSSKLNK